MLVSFSRKDGRPVHVNAARVAYVASSQKSDGTVIAFSGGEKDSVMVTENVDIVRSRIEGALTRR